MHALVVYSVLHINVTTIHLVFPRLVCKKLAVLASKILNAYVVTAVGERAYITPEEHVNKTWNAPLTFAIKLYVCFRLTRLAFKHYLLSVNHSSAPPLLIPASKSVAALAH